MDKEIISITSGKGGVGKTFVSYLLYKTEKRKFFVDADVDMPNLNILVGSKPDEKKELSIEEKARIKKGEDLCTKICPRNAIFKKDGTFFVEPSLCSGCGVCKILCKKSEIEFYKTTNAILYKAKKDRLAWGKLIPGEKSSGKVVNALLEWVMEEEDELIVDTSAGTGCPVNAALSFSKKAIVVFEPTLSSFLDGKRVIKVIEHFKIPYGIIINKKGLNKKIEEKIKEFAKRKKAKVLFEIGFKKEYYSFLSGKKGFEKEIKDLIKKFKKNKTFNIF